MLNCTDIACILHHHHEDELQHHLQDDRAHHEHQVQIMSGDTDDDVIQNILNGTTDSELSSLAHVDAPSDSLYMVCGVLIAMVLVAVIIILLAVTISKLRKREEHGSVTTNHNNNVIQTSDVVVSPPPQPPVPAEPPLPPPFFWRYSSSQPSNNSSQFSLCNNDQANLVHTLPCEEPSECKGFRKNLRGKWRRLVKKKPQQEVYTIPAELRDQLKQIYVY